jgi:hypothetical protein
MCMSCHLVHSVNEVLLNDQTQRLWLQHCKLWQARSYRTDRAILEEIKICKCSSKVKKLLPLGVLPCTCFSSFRHSVWTLPSSSVMEIYWHFGRMLVNFYILHGVTSKKTVIFIPTTVRTPNLASNYPVQMPSGKIYFLKISIIARLICRAETD